MTIPINMPTLYFPHCEGDPFGVSRSYQNLARLGLLTIAGHGAAVTYPTENFDDFLKEKIDAAEHQAPQGRKIRVNEHRGAIRINDFGRSFANVCLRPPNHPTHQPN